MIVLRCLDNLGQIRIRTVETTTFEKNLLRTDWLLFWQGAAGQAGLPAILTCFLLAGRPPCQGVLRNWELLALLGFFTCKSLIS